jgi:hypothetical protein
MAITHLTKRKSFTSEAAASSQKGQTTTAPLGNLQNEIRKRAEEIYHQRNGGPGNQLTDWLQAEKEVTQKYNIFSRS